MKPAGRELETSFEDWARRVAQLRRQVELTNSTLSELVDQIACHFPAHRPEAPALEPGNVEWFQSALPTHPPTGAADSVPPRHTGSWLGRAGRILGEAVFDFDEDAYFYFNSDVAQAVSNGRLSCGLEHWLLHGKNERRPGGPAPNVLRSRGAGQSLPFGVNFYGFFSSVSGLGSAARNLMSAMEEARLPAAKFDLPNWEAASTFANGIPLGEYRVNLIHQNADVLPLFFHTYGQKMLVGRYNIAHCVWELPSARTDWSSNLRPLDEIWVPSEFCRNAFSAITPLPVVTIPYVVDSLERVAVLHRRQLGLPEGPFIFAYVFDVSSGFERKNPLAVVEAFKRAFGHSREVLLLLKCFNSKYAPERMQSLRSVCRQANIRLVDEVWTSGQIHSLHKVIDCFVSPHRGEGFGLNLAETMYFGNAVIATAYSSNVDFMTPANSYLLDFRLKEIKRNTGPYLRGNVWAEPSVDHLTYLMRRVFEQESERAIKGRIAAADIRTRFSAASVGSLIRARLAALGLDQPQSPRLTSGSVEHPRFKDRFLPRQVPASAKRELRRLRHHPLISVITPVYNVEPAYLRRCIESVREQWYPFWELCLCDDGSTREDTRQVLAEWQGRDPRIKVIWSRANEGISSASNKAAEFSTGEFLAFLDNDDELTPDALLEVAAALNRKPDLDLLYSDEDKIDEEGRVCDHFFKPGWSPEHLQSVMYVLHLMVVRKALFFDVGGFRNEYSGAQDYDLALRMTGRTSRVMRIPKVLYHWRKLAGSAAAAVAAKPAALEAGTRALQDFVKRHNLPAEVLPGQLVGFSRVRYRVLRSPKVALCIIASNKVATLPGRGEVCLVENFVKSIVSKTLYTNYEIVVCHDNNLDLAVTARLDALGCRLLGYPGPSAPFNFAKKTNFAIRHAEAPHAVLLNDDMEVISPDWLSALLEYTQQPAIGAAGGRLLYPDGSIQHAGVAIGINQGAGHLFHGAPGGYVGYNGFTHLVRNCSAVTGACLAMRTAVFEEAGGFDEGFGVDYNDTDFCLTLIERGYRIVYTPYCELYHFEGQSLPRHAQNAREVDRFRQKWVKYVEDDPYYNPNLSRDRLDCAVDSRRSSWRPGVMTRS